MAKTIEDQIASILKGRPSGMRIAQFIHNATLTEDIYYWSDEKFLQILKDYRKECKEAADFINSRR